MMADEMQHSEVSSSAPEIPFATTNVDPQKTNSTAKGLSKSLQPLHAVSTRSRKQIPKETLIKTVCPVNLCHTVSNALG